PGVRESSPVFEGTAFICSLGVISSDHYGSTLVGEHSHVLIDNHGCLIRSVHQIREKLGLIHHRAVVVGIDKGVRQHARDDGGIVVHLGLVPLVFQSQDLAFVCLFGSSRQRSEKQRNYSSSNCKPHGTPSLQA